METYKDDREEILSRQIKVSIGRAGRRNKCVDCRAIPLFWKIIEKYVILAFSN